MTHISEHVTKRLLALVKELNEGTPHAGFNWDYYRGYCHAVEDANGLPRNDIWHTFKDQAVAYCNKYNSLQQNIKL